jgi:RNA polymerase sigma factor (sigma-70 family)
MSGVKVVDVLCVKRRRSMMDMNKAIEFATRLLYKECRNRGIVYNEDLVQDAALKAVMAVKMFDERRGAPFSSYLWRAINNMLHDWCAMKNRDLLNVSIWHENEDGEESVLDIPASDDRNFNDELMGILLKYQGKVGKDFCELVLGYKDVDNALRSVANSRKRGEKWIEGWLGRRLSREERACCSEIRMMLREV